MTVARMPQLNSRVLLLDDATSSDVQHTGVMVAFILPVDVARRLALPGGEPVDELHITLAYLGDLSEYDPSADLSPLDDVVAAYASETVPLSGSVSGLGRFNPSESSEGKAPIIALVNVPGLQEWRAGLVQRLQAAGFSVSTTFAYTPHITLAYVDAGAPMPVKYIPSVPLVLDQVTVAIGDDRQVWALGAGASSPGALSRSMSMSLDEGDPLDQWLSGMSVRVDLQAQLGWAGLQDGYLAAGASDNANPFWFVYWLLDPGARQHCFDCPQMAANSPYNAPGSGGNELWQTPGDGNTECGAGCKCSLSYGPGPTGVVSIDQERLANFLPQDMPAPAGVDVTSTGAEGADYGTGDQGMPPDGNTGGTVQAHVTTSPGPSGPPPSTRDWLPQVTGPATLPAGTDTLSDGQKAALDRFRTAADAWDAIADGLPAAPFLWQMTEIPGAVPGEVTAGSGALDALAAEADALPYWEFLTGDQQHELHAMIDAIVDFGDATDALDNGGEFTEWVDDVYLLGYPNQPRDSRGRYGPTGNTGHHGEGEGGEGGGNGTGASGGGGKQERPEGARYAGGKLLPAAGYDVSLVVHADGSRAYKPQAVNLKGERSDVPSHAHESFGTREEAVRRTYDLAHEHASTTVVEAHIPVTYLHERAHDVVNERAGHALSDEEIAGLAGALPGMRVEVDRSGMLIAVAPDGSRTYTYVMHRSAHESLAQHGIDHEAGVGLYLSHRLNAEGEQIAFSPRQVQEQVHAAQRSHVVSLITKGRGLEIDAKLLPQLGFTTRINEHLFAELRHRWYDMPQHWSWLHQALNRESFLADWERNGTSAGLAFDLKPGSWSQKRLQRYINDHTSQETA